MWSGNRGRAWAYGMHPGEYNYFHEKREELAAINLCALERASLLFFGFFFAVILLGEATGERNTQDVFALFLLIQAGVYAVACHAKKKQPSPRCMTIALLCYLASFSVGGIVLSLEQEGTGTAILAVLLIIELLFVLPPLYTGLLNVTTVSIFIALTIWCKPWEVARLELFHTLCFFLLALLLGWNSTRGRVEEAAHRGRLERLNTQLYASANTDFLTGLENRRKFQSTLSAVFEDCALRGTALGIIMIDIDSFKLYNDHYGHVQGDVCLQRVGRSLQTYCQEGFSVYRYGGEEFVALLTGPCVKHTAELAEQLCQAVRALQIPHCYSRASEGLSVSVGSYAAQVQAGETAEQYLEKADQAMYRSKYLGGNRAAEFRVDFDCPCTTEPIQ